MVKREKGWKERMKRGRERMGKGVREGAEGVELRAVPYHTITT